MFIFRKFFLSILVFLPFLSYASSTDSDKNLCKEYGVSVRYILSDRMGGKTKKETIQKYKEIVNSMNKDISAETYDTLMKKSVARAYSLKLYSGNFLKNRQISNKFAKDEEKFCIKELANMHRKINEDNAKVNAEIQRLQNLKRKLSSSKGVKRYHEITNNSSDNNRNFLVYCADGSSGNVSMYPIGLAGYGFSSTNGRGITITGRGVSSFEEAIQSVCQ